MDKFGIQVNYNKDSTSFQIHKDSTLNKLYNFIEIYFEEIKGSNYQLLYEEKNLKELNSSQKLSSIFKNETNSDILLNLVNYEEGTNPNFKIEVICIFENSKKSFLINPSLNFLKFKYNILALFPQLDEDNYMIIYKDIDITNIYPNEKLIKEVFNIDLSKTNSLNNIIEIELQSKLKTIIEYYKRCSFCHDEKATNICKKCCIASCDKCNNQDSHIITKKNDFVPIVNFNQFEQKTLSEILKKLLEIKSLNEKMNSDNLNQFFEEKINLLKSKFINKEDEIIELRDVPVNNLKKLLDTINNKFHPEEISTIISDLYNLVLKYKENPFYDCEESMKKINEFLKNLELLLSNFNEYNNMYNDFYEKYKKCMEINTNLEINLENYLIDSKLVFEKGSYFNRYNRLMKIYDNSRVLVFDYNILKFKLMYFLDQKEQFKDNLNNFIQVNCNYDNMEKIFIITGVTSQKFFIYDYNSNEMQYIGMLKFTHNWWPSLIPVRRETKTKKELFLFCLSGTYTNKCELLIFKDIEIDLSDIENLEQNEINELKNGTKNEETNSFPSDIHEDEKLEEFRETNKGDEEIKNEEEEQNKEIKEEENEEIKLEDEEKKEEKFEKTKKDDEEIKKEEEEQNEEIKEEDEEKKEEKFEEYKKGDEEIKKDEEEQNEDLKEEKNNIENGSQIESKKEIKSQKSEKSKSQIQNQLIENKKHKKKRIKSKNAKYILKWQEIPSTKGFHGQGASFIYNNTYLYLLFGYDFKLNPITLIERLNIENINSLIIENGGNTIINWEQLDFKNPNDISSILYYNALLKVDDEKIYIVGGLKEINEIDFVYQYDVKENSLLKTDKKINFESVKFSNEKNFISLNKDNDFVVSNNFIKKDFGIIDGKNNVHLINVGNFKHTIIPFNP